MADIESVIVKTKDTGKAVLYKLDSGDEIWCAHKRINRTFSVGQTVKFFYEESDWNGKTNKWAFKAVEKGASAAPASSAPSPTAPAKPQSLPQVAPGSKYTPEDKEAFRKKDDLMVRMAAQKNACMMTEAYAGTLRALPGTFKSADEAESALSAYYEFWNARLLKELKGEAVEPEPEIPF